jgi:hypothetical protein
VIIGNLSESEYRRVKPHRTMSDDSEREKAFASKMRKQQRATNKDSDRKKKAVGSGVAPNGSGVISTIGACAAMGAFCHNKQLENARHYCSSCGKGMHIVGACCGRYDLNSDSQICGMCVYGGDNEGYSKAAATSKKMSRDMLLDSDSAEEAEFEDVEEEVESEESPRASEPMPLLPGQKAAVAARLKKTPPPAAAPVVAPAVKKRGPNFSPEEDTFITRAWCSRKGSDQRQQDFNKTLFSNFVTLVDEYNDQVRNEFMINLTFRNQKGIIDRCAKIKKAASQFAGVVSRNKIRSGEDYKSHMERCCQVYEQTYKTKFVWLECFEILQDCPKWNAPNDEAAKQGQVASVSGKRKNQARNTGKRQKALSDKIERMVEKHSSSTGVADRLSVVGGTLNQMTSHMVEQLNFAHWTDEDKSTYFSQDAKEKALQQQKRILMLQMEVSELKGGSVVTGGTLPSDDDEDD